ncbi:MAG: acyl-CoA dehydrogenase family protein [Phycisphaerales bacterium]|nr:acyl-CoA dehydrogenase family protein [Phycisphaerales bacterium]
MPNFFYDNDDIQFLFHHFDLAELARIQERGFADAAGTVQVDGRRVDYAPADETDAVDNYRRVLGIVGEVAGETIAPRAERIDAEGNTLNEDGTVTLHPLVADNLRRLAQADLMGFTLPRKYGGLNCPNLVYTMAIEIVSRADASLMNIFGLQGIAETINAFADDAIKDEYLPRFARGDVTGAMVLTEPDAGSDLQAVRLRAYEEDGQWYLRGVKRFITNGCGEVLLTLARSEPDVSDGRGLSLFLSERSPRVRVRHLEHKLGIHGSPTCELVYDDAPARLIGQRQRGLITYVMALMNGARVGIAAQSLGIAEAAFRLARTYAHSRKQFGGPIERLPAVAEMLTDMRIQVEAARALTYETSRVCDLENNNNLVLEGMAGDPPPADELKTRKELARAIKRLNGMLTPMSKYYASEMCIRVADQCVQVLGGSGYMTDYPAERYLRDARITTIYEGTSQLQIVAAVRGVCSGAFEKRLAEFEELRYEDELLAGLREKLVTGREQVLAAIAFVKNQGTEYLDLAGRRLVDAAAAVYIGHLFLQQAAAARVSKVSGIVYPASTSPTGAPDSTGCFSTAATASTSPSPDEQQLTAWRQRKARVARRFIETEMPKVRLNCESIASGDRAPLAEFELLAGPVPPKD